MDSARTFTFEEMVENTNALRTSTEVEGLRAEIGLLRLAAHSPDQSAERRVAAATRAGVLQTRIARLSVGTLGTRAEGAAHRAYEDFEYGRVLATAELGAAHPLLLRLVGQFVPLLREMDRHRMLGLLMAKLTVARAADAFDDLEPRSHAAATAEWNALTDIIDSWGAPG
ncbi:hypothetical protein [Nocardia neocaledoniensis]|uniref:hypothetical protein n=1 Tax=Nocardia neocaledoniensis TaxID=236511 RepID=UPI0024563E79|nr:hypothetical protein [Nocardia neocaledoniensis]